MKKSPLKSLILLGRIGRALVVFAAALFVLTLCMTYFYGDNGKYKWSSASMRSEENMDSDRDGKSSNSLEVSSRVPTYDYSFQTVAQISNSLQSIFRNLVGFLGFFCMYRVFHHFANGNVFSERVGQIVLLLGACCLCFSVSAYFEESELTEAINWSDQLMSLFGKNDGDAADTGYSSSLHIKPKIEFLFFGIILVSLGQAIRYGALIEEENKLTV